MFKLILMGVTAMLLLTGCGHNVVTKSTGYGINLSWEGDSYVPSLKLGYWDVSNATVRENVKVEIPVNNGVAVNKNGVNVADNKGNGTAIKVEVKDQTNGYDVELEEAKTKGK